MTYQVILADPGSEIRTGTAGEHLVIADLLIKGHGASLASHGLPYDVIADVAGRLCRVQVKTTRVPKDRKARRHFPVYTFNLRRAKGATRRYAGSTVDVIAFVALDIRQVAYLRATDLVDDEGQIAGGVEFRSTRHGTKGRLYSNGTQREVSHGRFLEHFAEFPL